MKKTHLQGLLWLALGGVALASLLSLGGVWWESLDGLAHFRLHYAVMAGGLAVFFFLLRQPKGALLALVFGLGNLGGSLFYYDKIPASAIAAEAGGRAQTLRILTLNSRAHSRNEAQIRAFISRMSPDMILLQEIPPWKTSLLTGLRRDYPYQVSCPEAVFCRIALLSRIPWQKAQALSLGREAVPVAWAQFGSKLANLRVVNVHLHRPYYSGQRPQVEDITRQILANTPGPLLVGGDFNATAWSALMRYFSRLTGLRQAGGFLPTWPKRSFSRWLFWLFPQLQIDHFYLSSNISLRSIFLGPDVGSDHLPLVVDVAIYP